MRKEKKKNYIDRHSTTTYIKPKVFGAYLSMYMQCVYVSVLDVAQHVLYIYTLSVLSLLNERTTKWVFVINVCLMEMYGIHTKPTLYVYRYRTYYKIICRTKKKDVSVFFICEIYLRVYSSRMFVLRYTLLCRTYSKVSYTKHVHTTVCIAVQFICDQVSRVYFIIWCEFRIIVDPHISLY